ncbi:hypothetical protein L9F63_009869 [Diploptera punctata]|uniref:Cyclic nucleotide-binding domain-containing protein n=1 Tax=Diploptera punctata TaxID=6984 RepID=A0AAD8AIK3_DIPPU|nr:hypothetical protein L9F63_009869 [Diploptera punctata]
MDIVTIPPIEVFGFFAPRKDWLYYIAILRINRLPRIFLLHEYFEERKSRLNINVFYMRLLSLILRCLLLVHTLTCIHVFLQCTIKQCDIPGITFKPGHRIHTYLYIMNTIMQTMTTTSFSITVGQNIRTLVYFTLLTIIGIMFSAVLIGEVYNTLVMATFSIGKYVVSVNKMKASIGNNNLSESLIKRLWINVVNFWNIQRGHHYPKMLAEAPSSLRQKVNTYLYEKHLRECHVFYHCDEDLLRQIAVTMKETLYLPGYPVVIEGDIDNSMYFIHSGEVKVIQQGKLIDQTVGILKAGDTFGLAQGLLDREPHFFTYYARTQAVIVRLTKYKWEHLLDFFPAAKDSIETEVSYLG